jgi:hypothetical protein
VAPSNGLGAPSESWGLGPWKVEPMMIASGHGRSHPFSLATPSDSSGERAFSGNVSGGSRSVPDLVRPARFHLGLAHQQRDEFCWVVDTKDVGLASHDPEIPRGKVGEIASCACQVPAEE